MPESIRYAHTNLVADNWERLRDFYVEVLGCVPVSTERSNSGRDFDVLTGFVGGSVKGRQGHLGVDALQGGGGDGGEHGADAKGKRARGVGTYSFKPAGRAENDASVPRARRTFAGRISPQNRGA